jgi:hypothetical protein
MLAPMIDDNPIAAAASNNLIVRRFMWSLDPLWIRSIFP